MKKFYENFGFLDCGLKEPLKPKEFDCYYRKYKLERDMSARKILIEHNIRLVLKIAAKFSNTSYSPDDLVEVGVIGLIKSVDTFDICKNTKFGTYAARCITNEMLMLLRRDHKHINDVDFDTEICVDPNGKRLTVEDTLYDEKADFVSAYEDKELYIALHRIMEGLPECDQLILKMTYGFPGYPRLKQKEIAAILNISQSYVSRKIKTILNKMRTKLYREGLVETDSRDKTYYK